MVIEATEARPGTDMSPLIELSVPLSRGHEVVTPSWASPGVIFTTLPLTGIVIVVLPWLTVTWPLMSASSLTMSALT